MAVDRLKEQWHWGNLPLHTKRGVIAKKESLEDELGERLSGLELVMKTTEPQVRGKKALDELRQHSEENGGFVFALFNGCVTMDQRFPSLNQSDLARLMFIGTYTNYDGRLQYDNGRPMDRKSLESLMNMSRARFLEFFKKLAAEEIIRVDEEHGDIYVNPSVFYRGEMKKSRYDLSEYQYTRLFRSTVRDLYNRYNGRTIKQLALVFAVLPFINFGFNVVSFNPGENNEDRVKPMDLENLAALLSYKDTHKLRTALDSLKLDGKPVFLLIPDVNDRRKRRIIVNPRVVFAGPAKSLAAIKVLFN